MKLLANFIFITSSLCHAQDSVLSRPYWRNYLSSLTEFNEKAYNMTFRDFETQYQVGQFHNILLVFRADAKQSQEEQILFTGLGDLCDPRKPLLIKHRNQSSTYPVDKKNLLAFVMNEYMFRSNYPKLQTSDYARWGIVVLNGPVHTVKTFRVTLDPTGPIFHDDFTTLKKTAAIGSDPRALGGLSFKRGMSKLLDEFPELSGKIKNEEEGYLKENSIDIIREYNEWVKENEPDVYNSYVYLKM